MRLPLPLPILAAAVGGAGYLIGHTFAGAGTSADTGAGAAPAPGANPAPGTDPFSSMGSASLNFGDAGSGAGTLNGVTPGGSPVGDTSGGDFGGGDTTPPAPGPAPAPPPPTGTAPAPAPTVKTYTAHFAQGAIVRIYSLSGSGASACISGWTDRTWTSGTSRAPCQAPIHRMTCSGSSGATTARVTAGAFAGKYIRVGTAGVTVTSP